MHAPPPRHPAPAPLPPPAADFSLSQRSQDAEEQEAKDRQMMTEMVKKAPPHPILSFPTRG